MAISRVSYLFALLTLLQAVLAVSPARRLRPVPRGYDLRKRSASFVPNEYETEFLFVDDGSSSPFALLTTMSHDLPTVMLDEISHYFAETKCGDTTIDLTFVSSSVVDHAHNTWSNYSSFVVVTSAQECGCQDSYKLYQVSEVGRRSSVLSLSVTEVELKQTSKNLKLKFGEHVYHENVHAGLRARDQVADRLERRQTSSAGSSFVAPSSQPGDVSFPFPSPSSSAIQSASKTLVSASVQTTYANTPILPPASDFGQKLIAALPVPQNMQLSCVDCNFEGNIELSDGDFSFDLESETPVTGFVDMRLPQGFKAHVSLELQLFPGFQLEQYIAQFPPVPIPFLSIPIADGGVIGIYFIPVVTMGVQLESEIDFFAGFEVLVPAGTDLYINIGSLDQSYSRGFTAAEVSLLPFNVHAAPPALTFYAALQPRLQLGLTIGSEELSFNGGVGAFFNTPRVNLDVANVQTVNDKCEPVSAGNAVDGTLVNLKPNIVLDAGVYADLAVGAAGFHASIGTSAALATTAFPLPTACLRFNGHDLVGASWATKVGVEGVMWLAAGCVMFSASALFLAWL